MATIKTTGTGTGLRILTKTDAGIQRVSCSCCEEAFCCPYPADQLGVGYFASDLPETLIIREGDLVPRYVSRTGNLTGTIYGPVVFEKTVIRGDETFIVEYSLSIEIAERSLFGLEWYISTLQDGFEVSFDPFSTCLYGEDDPANSSFSAITDTFEDAYEVEFLDGKQVTVTRESLCSWFGTATIGGFEYEASLAYNDETFQWEASFSTVDITSGLNSKDGNQNTPVGTYSGDNVITVSE